MIRNDNVKHRSSTAQVGFSERNNRYMHKEVLSVLKSNAILGRPFRFGGFPLRIFGIGGPLVTMATQDHNDLLRGRPVSRGALLTYRHTRKPAAKPRNTTQLVTSNSSYSSPPPGSSYYNKVIANFVPQRWSFACWGDQPRIYASLYVCARVCIVCADADQLRLLPVPYILESIKARISALGYSLDRSPPLTFRRGCLDDTNRFRGLNIKWRWRRHGENCWLDVDRVFLVFVKLEYGVIGI